MEEKRCRRCGLLTVAGCTDTQRAALPYVLDPDPMDAVGELQATVAGRRTWTLHSSGAVHLRTAAVILTRPAGTPRQTVHADHACTGRGAR